MSSAEVLQNQTRVSWPELSTSILRIMMNSFFNIGNHAHLNKTLFFFEIGLPLIEVQQTKSFREVPSIAITFANGVKDSMVLERFYPTQESRMARTPSCNFIGHLENEKTACVSLTGCASSDDLHFTINSKNSGSSNMYILHKDGNLELVESAFKVGI